MKSSDAPEADPAVVPEPEVSDAEAPKPCAVRLGYGSWCFLLDGHGDDIEHQGAPPQYGPVEAFPVIWRNHKGRQK